MDDCLDWHRAGFTKSAELRRESFFFRFLISFWKPASSTPFLFSLTFSPFSLATFLVTSSLAAACTTCTLGAVGAGSSSVAGLWGSTVWSRTVRILWGSSLWGLLGRGRDGSESREGDSASSWDGLAGSVGLGVGGLENILDRRADFLGLFWGSWEREEVEVEAILFQAACEVEDRAGAEIRAGSWGCE